MIAVFAFVLAIFAGIDTTTAGLVAAVAVALITQTGLVIVGLKNARASERAKDAEVVATRAASEATTGAAMADAAFRNMTTLLERADHDLDECQQQCREVRTENAELRAENIELHREIIDLRQHFDRINATLTRFIQKYGDTP